MTISQVWQELEDEGAGHGEFRRRIHQESIADLYLVVHKPANTRALLIDVDLSSTDIGELPTGRGIDLRWIPSSAGGQVLELVLSQPAFADLFDALVTDVAAAAAAGTDQHDVAAHVAARVRRWQTFLRETSTGLPPERQRGLYGELYFLRRLLLGAVPGDAAVAGWVGPLGALQDFAFGSAAVEVKTTIASQHQMLRIASERQLDSTALADLALFHLSVDGREGAGQSLPELVQEVRAALAESDAAGQFEDRLFTGGYLDAQAPIYRTGYTVREANIFLVGDDFPRLVEADCPSGVGDVTYSIAVSALSNFLSDATVLLSLVHGAISAQ